jgi:hypothetical protein
MGQYVNYEYEHESEYRTQGEGKASNVQSRRSVGVVAKHENPLPSPMNVTSLDDVPMPDEYTVQFILT